MDNLIDSTYFWGKLHLPYLNTSSETGTPSDEVIENEKSEFERYIARYQKEYLTLLFGSNVVPTEVSVATTINNMLADEDLLLSPIAHYVYCKVLSINQTLATKSGVTIHAKEKEEQVSYAENYYDVWNEMVQMNSDIREVLYNAGLDSAYPTIYFDLQTNRPTKFYRLLSFV